MRLPLPPVEHIWRAHEPDCPDEGNCWDSLITRELTAGTYTVKARVYSVGTGGWYKLTIDTV
jgi:hypothetical protein